MEGATSSASSALSGLLLLALAAAGLGGLALLATAARAGGTRRIVALVAGVGLVAAPLAEGGTRLALALGLAGRPVDGRAGDLYADDLVVPGLPSVPRHLLPAGDLPPAPAPDRFRVVVIGDSFAHGEGVRQDETFAHRLQALLHPADGRPVEVLNVSMSSLDLAAEHALFLGYGQAFAPDLVVWTFVLNDLGGGYVAGAGAGFDDLVVDRGDRAPGPSAAWTLLATGLAARRQEAEVVASYRASFAPERLDGVQRALGDVAAAVDAHGGRLLVVTFPLLWRLDDLPFADVHAAVLDRARAAGADTLDLGPVFQGREPGGLWATPRDHHPNALAHALAADAIAAAVGADLPRAHAGACHDGAGPTTRALCETPTASTALDFARELVHPPDEDARRRFLLRPFALAYAWTLADALADDDRDAARSEVLTLAAAP